MANPTCRQGFLTEQHEVLKRITDLEDFFKSEEFRLLPGPSQELLQQRYRILDQLNTNLGHCIGVL